MPYIAHIYLSLQYSICRPQCHILLIYISLYSTASAGFNAIYCSHVSLFTVQYLQASMPYIAHMYLSLQYSICRLQCHILLTCISLYSTASAVLNAIYSSYVSLFTVQHLQSSMPYIAHMYLSLQYSISRPQCHILLTCISLYSTASAVLNAIYCSHVSLFTVQHLQSSMPYIAHMYLSLQYSICSPQCHILLICISFYSTVSPGLNAIYLLTCISLYSTASAVLNAIYCSHVSLFTVQYLQASMPYIAHMYLSLQYSIFWPQCHILLIYISLYSTVSSGLNTIYCSHVSLFTVQYLQASMPYIAHMYLTLQYSICSSQCHILLICISLYRTVSSGLNAIYCSYVSLFTVQYLQSSMSYIAHIYLSLQYSICRPQCHILLTCISLYSTASAVLNAIYCSYVSLFTVQYLQASGLNAIYCSHVSLFTVQYLQASMPYIAHMYLSLQYSIFRPQALMPYIAHMYLSLQYSISRPQCHILLTCISLYSTVSSGLNAIYCSHVSLFTVQYLQASMPYIAHMYLSLQYSILSPQCHILLICISL